MKVANGKRVILQYELAIDDDDAIEIIESSGITGPLEYIHGEGRMLTGIEKVMEGMEIGEEKEGILPAAQAYGTPEMMPSRKLTRQDFPAEEKLEEGKLFTARDQEGHEVSFRVVKIDGENIEVRFDHPLAGKDIRYKLKVLSVTEA